MGPVEQGLGGPLFGNQVFRHPVLGRFQRYLVALLGQYAPGFRAGQVHAHSPGEQVGFVKGNNRRAGPVLGQNIEPGQGVHRAVGPTLGNFPGAVGDDFPPGHFQSVAGGYGKLIVRPGRVGDRPLRTPILRYDLQGRAKGRQIQVHRGQAVALQAGNVILHCPDNAAFDDMPRLRGRIPFLRPADQQDGAAGRRPVADVQRGFRFGFDGPSAGEAKAGFNQGNGDGVPSGVGLVGEHHGHYAVGLDDPAAFPKDGGHLVLIILGSQAAGGLAAAAGLLPKAGRAGDGFVHLVGQIGLKVFRENIAGGAFQPDIEKVGKFGVVDIVVIGRVKDDGVNAGGRQIQILGRAGNYPGRRGNSNGGLCRLRRQQIILRFAGFISNHFQHLPYDRAYLINHPF